MQDGAAVADTGTKSILRFGTFELDLRTSELRKKGLRIKLQEQPLQILAMLLEHPGELLMREEIRKRIWPANTFVDFDLGLNTAISRLRSALGDSAENPSYIETLPRRGYRFIGSVAEPCGSGISASKPESARIRLAVLPLNDYSEGRREDFFSDGMTEEMITQLGSLDPRRLGVIARTSIGRYKNTGKAIDEIGRELNVDYILEGSVRRAGGRVRISAQLIRVLDQTHVWAESYERDLRDVLMLQDEVAQSIARRIRIALTPQQASRFARQRQVDPEAFEAYLRGRYHWCKLSGDGWRQGRECFEYAIARDPDYAPGHAGLADCFIKFGQFGFSPPKETFGRAYEEALKAVALDDTLAEAHGSLAMIGWLHDWEWTAAEQEFRRAIALGPHIAIIRGWYALYLLAMGRMEECYREIQTGLELEPLGNLTNCMLGFFHHAAREYDLAIAQFRKCIVLHPHSLPVHFLLGQSFLARAKFDDAIASFQKAAQLSGGEGSAGMLGIAYVRSGRHDTAAQLLRDLQEKSSRTYVAGTTFAFLSLALGDLDQMYEYLDKAFGERDSTLVMLKCLPDFDPLRLDPRFESIVARMKFPT